MTARLFVRLFDSSYSILILLLLLASVLRKKGDRSRQTRLYLLMLGYLLLIEANVLFMDAGTVLGFSGGLAVSLFLLFVMDPGVLVLWMFYSTEWVNEEWKTTRVWLIPVSVEFIGNLIVCLINLKTGWLYVPYGPHMGDRGPFFLARAVVMFLGIPYTEIFLIRFRKSIHPENLFGLMFFPVFPVIGAVLQVILPSLPNTTNTGEVLAMLNLYLFVQDRISTTDSLTGIRNRRSLDRYLDERINSGKTFSGILIDVDRFKQINDNFGHAQGDVALQKISSLLREQCRISDLVSRYGGDEFCVILDSGDEALARRYISRIRVALDELNQTGRLSFQIGLSMGYAVFDPDSSDGPKQFIAKMDEVLYQEKERKREAGLR